MFEMLVVNKIGWGIGMFFYVSGVDVVKEVDLWF